MKISSIVVKVLVLPDPTLSLSDILANEEIKTYSCDVTCNLLVDSTPAPNSRAIASCEALENFTFCVLSLVDARNLFSCENCSGKTFFSLFLEHLPSRSLQALGGFAMCVVRGAKNSGGEMKIHEMCGSIERRT